MNEIEWMPVVGWPEYEVSDDGQVRSRRGVKKQHRDKQGYVRMQLWRDGDWGNVKVHRLVLEAFVGPCPDGMEAMHLNNVRDDNRLSNLAWGTRRENVRHTVKSGNNVNAAKTKCPAGHPYDATNTRVYDGKRFCRACQKERTNA